MKNKILAVLSAGLLVLGSSATSVLAQSPATGTATKPDKTHTEKSSCSSTSPKSPVDGSKSDKVGDATAPKSAGTDNPKTGVDPSKAGAADQTQTNK